MWLVCVFMIFTSNLEGSNLSGSGKLSGLWWMFLKSGKTFHPFGIRNPVKFFINKKDNLLVAVEKENFRQKGHQIFVFQLLPLNSTSSTASLKVKDKIEATLRVSWITLVVIGIFLVSAQFRPLSSPQSSFDFIKASCSSCKVTRNIVSPQNISKIKKTRDFLRFLGFWDCKKLESYCHSLQNTWIFSKILQNPR